MFRQGLLKYDTWLNILHGLKLGGVSGHLLERFGDFVTNYFYSAVLLTTHAFWLLKFKLANCFLSKLDSDLIQFYS